MNFFKKIINMFSKSEHVVVLAPCNGDVVETKQISDETFSQDMIGKGFGITPSSPEFVSPFDGEITLCEGHAISIKHPTGIEVLIHIGIDTVQINSDRKPNEPYKVFKHLIKVGDKVRAGQKLVEVEIDEIKKRNLSTMTPVIVLLDSLNGRNVKLIAKGEVVKGTEVLEVK